MTSDLHREAREWLDAYEQGMAFDAAAPRIVRDLLAEVEDDEREIADAAAMIRRAVDIAGHNAAERDEARATLDRIRAIALRDTIPVVARATILAALDQETK